MAAKQLSRCRGFTLIETVISVAIFAFLIFSVVRSCVVTSTSLTKLEAMGQLSDIKQSIINRIDCKNTVDNHPCDHQSVPLLDKKNQPIDLTSNTIDLEFTIRCQKKDSDYNLFPEYRRKGSSKWHALYDGIPIICPVPPPPPNSTNVTIDEDGLILDGISDTCLDPNTGILSFTQLFNTQYFWGQGYFETISSDGTSQQQFVYPDHSNESYQMPGDWSRICGVNISWDSIFLQDGWKGRTTQPIVTVHGNCLRVNDEMNRPGWVKFLGLDFSLTPCN